MSATLIIFRAGGSLADPPDVEPLAPSDNDFALLDRLRALLEDDIEAVPYFTSVVLSDGPHQCVAFCGEHGKLNRLPVNRRATMLWQAAIRHRIDLPAEDREALIRSDVLVGTVVIVIGDPAFMASL